MVSFRDACVVYTNDHEVTSSKPAPKKMPTDAGKGGKGRNKTGPTWTVNPPPPPVRNLAYVYFTDAFCFLG